MINGMFHHYIADQIAYVALDAEGSSKNIFTVELAKALQNLWKQLRQKKDLKGIIIYSNKENSFLTDSVVSMIHDCHSKEELYANSKVIQQCFHRIATCPIPTAAAIHGDCLGFGLELALACPIRVASDASCTQFGFPNVKAGFMPGGGGTLRLTDQIGLQESLPLFITGKTLYAKQAKEKLLVHDVTSKPNLMDAARRLIRERRVKGTKLTEELATTQWARHKIIDENKLGRTLILRQGRKMLSQATSELNPAPEQILELLEASYAKPNRERLAMEREAFAELALDWQAHQLQDTLLDDPGAIRSQVDDEPSRSREPRPPAGNRKHYLISRVPTSGVANGNHGTA